MSEQFISIQDVKKVYGPKKKLRKEALKGVSLNIHEGEVLGLLGVNGAGKTTLSSIIATLIPPSSGDLLWNGCSVYQNLNAYRKIVGLCPQKPNLDQLLTLEENLLFAGRFFGMREPEIRKKVDELVEMLELSGYRKALASTLSGGYKQRFLIARSLIHDPKLVILDEPTVGLDPHIRHELWKVIRSLRQKKVTTILTTHYLEEAEALVDRVCMIDHGEIKAVGNLEEIMKTYEKEKLEDVLLAIRSERSKK